MMIDYIDGSLFLLENGDRESSRKQTIEIPDDVRAAFDGNEEARVRFEKMPPSHQKVHLQPILGAKRPETRARRIAQMIAALQSK